MNTTFQLDPILMDTDLVKKSKVKLLGSETRIEFKDCKFRNMRSDDCAGIDAEGIDLLIVTNSEFYNNTGAVGGGLCTY